MRKGNLFHTMLLMAICVSSSAARSVSCPCDADVDNNGRVDVIDGACIADCKDNGNCSCCLSSCDVNCDGVVDVGDIGDDVINDPSAWLCLFQGGATEVCCAAPPPTGACCDTATGTCSDSVLEANCSGQNEVWSESLACSQVGCQAAPTGACCDLDFGTCLDDVTAANCSGANQEWSNGLSCAQASCPAPPTGACCNLGNGQCQDDVVSANCSGANFAWTQGTFCSAVSCSVPPQTPCPCDADVDNNGRVDVIDGACIADCKDNGNCSCCLSSCDVNCDGVVDTGDIGDDVINDPSVWLCLFQGGTTDACCAAPPPTGACCDTTAGTCNDSVLEADCSGQNEAWAESLGCSQVACQAAPTGACCNLDFGTCLDGVTVANCSGPNQEWSDGLTCAQASCPAPPTGACCNLGNGQCQDDVVSANCSGANFEWTQGTFCSAVSCGVPPQNPCPCDADVDNNGRVDVIDGACIADCKDNGNCSCCLSSCDVNCDGVVDTGDIGDDVINDPSVWLCLFQGGMTNACCLASGAACPTSSQPEQALTFGSSSSGASTAMTTNRYLMFNAGDTGHVQAIRVTAADLPAPYDVWNGQQLWVGPTYAVSENSGSVESVTGFPDMQVAKLQCSPYYDNWSALGLVHVHHELIVPGGVYSVQVVDITCDQTVENDFSSAMPAVTSRWADVSGPFDGATLTWLPPDGIIGVPSDVVALLDKFANTSGALSKARADLGPSNVDLIVDISDISRALDAFRGLPYPYEPGPPPCQ